MRGERSFQLSILPSVPSVPSVPGSAWARTNPRLRFVDSCEVALLQVRGTGVPTDEEGDVSGTSTRQSLGSVWAQAEPGTKAKGGG